MVVITNFEFFSTYNPNYVVYVYVDTNSISKSNGIEVTVV